MSKRKSTLFSNYSCIIIHRHVQIQNLSCIMDVLNVHCVHYILSSVKLFFDMNELYKNNMDGLFVTNNFALVATSGSLSFSFTLDQSSARAVGHLW